MVKIRDHFNQLKNSLCELLTTREETLVQEVTSISKDALAPLDLCEKLVKENLKLCSQLMQEGWCDEWFKYLYDMFIEIPVTNFHGR